MHKMQGAEDKADRSLYRSSAAYTAEGLYRSSAAYTVGKKLRFSRFDRMHKMQGAEDKADRSLL